MIRQQTTTALRVALLALVAALLILGGCSRGAEPTTSTGVVYLSALEPDAYVPGALPDFGSPITAAEREMIETRHIKPFEAQADAIMQRGDAETMERIETAYIATGRKLELVAHYDRDVKARGMRSHVAPRLAWLLMRLGQEKRGELLARQYLAANQKSGTAWFLLGAAWMRRLQEDQRAGALVMIAWERALTLDPNLRGFEGLGAQAVSGQVRQLQQRIPLSPVQRQLLTQQLVASMKVDAPKPGAKPTVKQPAPTEKTPGAKPPTTTPPTKTSAAVGTPGKTTTDAGAKPATKPATAGTPAEATPAAKTATPALVAAPATKTRTSVAGDPRVLLARAQMAAARGEAKSAAGFHRRAVAASGGTLMKAVVKQDADFAFRLVQLGWAVGDKNTTASAFRKLATRGDLSPELRAEMSVFASRKLEDAALASTLAK